MKRLTVLLVGLLLPLVSFAAPRTTISADGSEIVYELTGSGETTLVFVHDWCTDRRYWRDQVSFFAKDHQVLVVDLAGHGASGGTRTRWTVQAFADDVIAAVRDAGARSVILIGHSMGATVATETAVRLTEKGAERSGSNGQSMPIDLLGVVGIDAFHHLEAKPTPREVAKEIAPFESDFKRATEALARDMFEEEVSEELVEWIVRDMAESEPSAALASFRSALSNRPTADRLNALEVPVAAVNGAWRPTLLAPDESAGLQVIQIDGVGHFPQLTIPGRFNVMLHEIVEQMRGTAVVE